MQEQMKMNT